MSANSVMTCRAVFGVVWNSRFDDEDGGGTGVISDVPSSDFDSISGEADGVVCIVVVGLGRSSLVLDVASEEP